MRKKILIVLLLISFAYQYSFFNTYWIKDELVTYNPIIADIYWISAGLFGIFLGIYAMFKYKITDFAFFFSFLTFLVGLPIIGLFAIALLITSM